MVTTTTSHLLLLDYLSSSLGIRRKGRRHHRNAWDGRRNSPGNPSSVPAESCAASTPTSGSIGPSRHKASGVVKFPCVLRRPSRITHPPVEGDLPLEVEAPPRSAGRRCSQAWPKAAHSGRSTRTDTHRHAARRRVGHRRSGVVMGGGHHDAVARHAETLADAPANLLHGGLQRILSVSRRMNPMPASSAVKIAARAIQRIEHLIALHRDQPADFSRAERRSDLDFRESGLHGHVTPAAMCATGKRSACSKTLRKASPPRGPPPGYWGRATAWSCRNGYPCVAARPDIRRIIFHVDGLRARPRASLAIGVLREKHRHGRQDEMLPDAAGTPSAFSAPITALRITLGRLSNRGAISMRQVKLYQLCVCPSGSTGRSGRGCREPVEQRGRILPLDLQ